MVFTWWMLKSLGVMLHVRSSRDDFLALNQLPKRIEDFYIICSCNRWRWLWANANIVYMILLTRRRRILFALKHKYCSNQTLSVIFPALLCTAACHLSVVYHPLPCGMPSNLRYECEGFTPQCSVPLLFLFCPWWLNGEVVCDDGCSAIETHSCSAAILFYNWWYLSLPHSLSLVCYHDVIHQHIQCTRLIDCNWSYY
jgi:hypothetical protein